MPNAISIIKLPLALLVVLTVFGLIATVAYETPAHADDEAAVRDALRSPLTSRITERHIT